MRAFLRYSTSISVELFSWNPFAGSIRSLWPEVNFFPILLLFIKFQVYFITCAFLMFFLSNGRRYNENIQGVNLLGVWFDSKYDVTKWFMLKSFYWYRYILYCELSSFYLFFVVEFFDQIFVDISFWFSFNFTVSIQKKYISVFLNNIIFKAVCWEHWHLQFHNPFVHVSKETVVDTTVLTNKQIKSRRMLHWRKRRLQRL